MLDFLRDMDNELTPAYESVVLEPEDGDNITPYSDTTEADVEEMFEAQLTLERASIASDLIGLQLVQNSLLETTSMNRSKIIATYEASVKGAWESVKKFFKKIWAFIKKIFHKVKLRIESIFMDSEKFYDKYKSEIEAKIDALGGKLKVSGFKDYSKLDDALKRLNDFYSGEIKKVEGFKNDILSKKGDKEGLKKVIDEVDNYISSKSEYKLDTMIAQGPTTSSTEVSKATLLAEFAFASSKGKKEALDKIKEREKSATDALKKIEEDVKKLQSEASDDDKKNSEYMSAVKALTRMISKFITRVSTQLSMIAKMCNDRASQAYSLMRRLANEGYADKVKVRESYDFDAVMRSLY